MSFAGAGVRPLESYERRYIRYRLVRLLNCPDEVRASEIAFSIAATRSSSWSGWRLLASSLPDGERAGCTG